MDAVEKRVLNQEFFDDFRSWVNFNMESLTWQGRYEKEFEEFWTLFFTEHLSIKVIIQRFAYSCEVVKVGPLVAWFNWLRNKFICFVYIRFNYSIQDLSVVTGISIKDLSFTLREFFVEKFPHLEDYFSEKFQISHSISPNIQLKFSDIKGYFALEDINSGSIQDEVLPSMEVTLYEEWLSLLEKMRPQFVNTDSGLSSNNLELLVKSSLKIVRDVLALVCIAATIIWLIKNFNSYYENYLIDRISVYEPQFKWLDKNLNFKQIVKDDNIDTKVQYEIEETKSEVLTKEEEAEIAKEVFQTESEVMVTSWDALPRDISAASLEQSDYEEKKTIGYRDYRYGRNKVYRVLLKTSDFLESRERLNVLSKKYQAEQVDNVRPGKFVPGGAYYNLYVPRAYLKEFLAQVMEQDQGVLYESRTRGSKNPEGKNKVFIWVKSI